MFLSTCSNHGNSDSTHIVLQRMKHKPQVSYVIFQQGAYHVCFSKQEASLLINFR